MTTDYEEIADILTEISDNRHVYIHSKDHYKYEYNLHKTNIFENLINALEKSTTISLLKKKYYCLPSEVDNFNIVEIAKNIVAQVMNGADPWNVVLRLFDICDNRKLEILYVQNISDIDLFGEFNLDDKVKVVSASSMPLTQEMYAQLTEKETFTFGLTPPTGAIVIRIPEMQVIFDDIESANNQIKYYNKIAEKLSQTIEMALNALTLSSISIPDMRNAFFAIVEDGAPLPRTINMGMSQSYARKPVVKITPDHYNAEILFKAMNKFNNIDIMNIVISKLKNFRREDNYVDKYINMGTCIEILMMHGAHSENTEINYKISMRSAWLVGLDQDDRVKVFEFARKLYNYRSKAVHN